MTGARRHPLPKGNPLRTIVTRSPEETHRLGEELAATLAVPGVILLCGTLGTGKTTLTRGLAHGLGLKDPAAVHSPSFTLVNVYHGRCLIYHVDLYRLSDAREIESVGLEDFLGRDGVTIVEWGERLASYRGDALMLELEDAGGDSRMIRMYHIKGANQKLHHGGHGGRRD